MTFSLRIPIFCMAIAFAAASYAQERAALPDGAVEKAPVGRQADGRVIVPTSQVLEPAGKQIEFGARPADLWLSPDGGTLLVKSHKSMQVIDTKATTMTQMFTVPGTSFHGIAGTKDGSRVYVSLTKDAVAELGRDAEGKWEMKQRVELDLVSRDKSGPVPGGIAFLEGEKELLVTLSRNNTLGIVDLVTSEIDQIDVGVCPYGVITKDGKAWVSNWAGRSPHDDDTTGPTSGSPMVVAKSTFSAATGTVSVVDLKSRKVETTIDVGLHPCALLLSTVAQRLFVANANSDTVSVIDTDKSKVVETISVRPNPGLPFGSAPNALALTPDGKTLYVACGTNNCVVVVRLSSGASGVASAPESTKTAGSIPVAWYPGALLLDTARNMLYVANVKGVGSLTMPVDADGHNSHHHRGSLSMIPLPTEKELPALTERVNRNNRLQWSLTGLNPGREKSSDKPVPVPLFKGEKSVFKHVIYIIRENRTYDQVFGDIPEGNGEKSLCIFGEEVTPNLHALAREFVLLDNFYCGGVLSADGHFWATSAYVTDYLEKAFGGFPRSYPYEGEDMMAVSAGGFIWDKVLAAGMTFRNYGEMVTSRVEPKGVKWLDIYRDFTSGTMTAKVRAVPTIKTIEPYTCPEVPGFPMVVPDVVRADVFLREFREFEKNGNLPNFIIMLLPNDHTAGTRPGFPTPRAMVADNDLAVGRIVAAVSASRFWPETCIFMTEDDPQAGFDHVDGHRTIGFVVSPYTKRGYVDSTNYNQMGMLRTMELILGVTAMNQIDLASTPMVNCFTDKPNLKPFKVLPNRIPLDEMNPDKTALTGPERYWAEKSEEQNFDEVDKADEDTLNRILWHSVKGCDVPYPAQYAAAVDSDDDD